VQRVPGTHHGIMDTENVGVLARTLERHFDR
jgi:hypothetical protein